MAPAVVADPQDAALLSVTALVAGAGGATCALSIAAGELVVALVDESADAGGWGDLLLGLRKARDVEVRCLGRAWTAHSAAEARAARSAVGRVFARDAWVSSLTIEENVLLPHLARGAEEDAVRAEVGRLCGVFGCSWGPGDHAEDLPRDVQQVAQWVRALAGRPRLLLLERPLDGVAPRRAPLLLSTVRRFADEGGGALWLTASAAFWQHPDLSPARSIRIGRTPGDCSGGRETR